MSVVEGKVALITGGASGIGLEYAKVFLRNGIKGVSLVDLNPQFGRQAADELSKEFGADKVIFIQTDVTNKKLLEDSFKKTVEKFKQLDIVINNAGILNDKIWEREIDINITSLVHGSLLAFEEYLPKYKSGEEGYLVNIASIVGLDPFICVPIYTGTKHFVIGFSRGLGAEPHYQRTKVKVIVICPGVTDTPLISEMKGRNLGPAFDDLVAPIVAPLKTQPPDYCAIGLLDALQKGSSGSVWLVEGKEPAVEIDFPHRDFRHKK